MDFLKSNYSAPLIFAVVFVALFIIIRVISRNKTLERFDERQLIARNQAYKTAFFTMLFCSVAEAFLDMFGYNVFEGPSGFFLIVFAGISVFGCVAISKDAFVGLGTAPKRYIILYIIITAAQLVNTVTIILDGELIVDGKLTLNSISLFCFLTFLAILLAFAAKIILQKKEEMED